MGETSTGGERRSVGYGGANANTHRDGWPTVGTHQSHATALAPSAADRAQGRAHASFHRDGRPNVGAPQSRATASAAAAGDRSQALKLPQSVVPSAVVFTTVT